MTKEFLLSFRSKVKEGKQLQEQLYNLESRMYSPKSQRFSQTPRGSGDGHTMDDLAIAHLELADLYRSKLADIAREQANIEHAMETLTPAERMIVRYRYIDLMRWEDICDRVHYGWTQTHKLHGSALRKLAISEE